MVPFGPWSGYIQLEVIRDSDAWRFTVHDSGSGMRADVLERAGEPFFTTKAPGQGMGLGLFLTRTVLARLGGTLELSSQPGRGTTAVLTLPATVAATLVRVMPQRAAFGG